MLRRIPRGSNWAYERHVFRSLDVWSRTIAYLELHQRLPRGRKHFPKYVCLPSPDRVQMAMSALYGFFGVCFWSLATLVGSSVPSILTNPSPTIPITAAWFYGTGNLAGLSGLLFLFAAPGE